MERKNGAFLIARQLFESELWLWKPSSWKIIWIYILGKVNHTDTKNFKRGEGFFQFTNECPLIGKDITPDMVKKFLQFSRKNEMLSTKRSTRGVRLKVLKYNEYQTLDNYESTNRSTREAPEKHQRSTPIHKNVKNDKNDKKEYSKPSLQDSFSKKIPLAIKKFEIVNPLAKNWYGHKTYRGCIAEVFEAYGAENVLGWLDIIPKTNKMPYMPSITTPLELKQKLQKLIDTYAKK